VSWRRQIAAGLTAAGIVVAVGLVMEAWRFGLSDDATAGRIEAQVEADFTSMTAALERVATLVAGSPKAASGVEAGDDGQRALFDLLGDVRRSRSDTQDVAVTIYDARGVAHAWAGRPSDIPPERISGPPGFFVTPSPLGLRLVYIKPVLGTQGRRAGAVAAENILSPAAAAGSMTPAEFRLANPIARVALRTRYEGAGDRGAPGTIVLRSPDGTAIAEASIARSDLHAARQEWRAMVGAEALAALAITLWLLIGPLLDRRAAAREPGTFVLSTLASSLLLAAGSATLWIAFAIVGRAHPPFGVNLILLGGTAAGLASLWTAGAARLRLHVRASRVSADSDRVRFVLTQLAAGMVVAAILVLAERFFATIIESSTIDLRHFSLHPWNTTRTSLFGGLLAVHLAVLWSATILLLAAPSKWRIGLANWRTRLFVLLLWTGPTAVAATLTALPETRTPAFALLASCLVCALFALFGRSLVSWYRHATAVARLLALFLAFLVPSLLLYPSINDLSERATRRLITTQYAVEAQNHAQRLQELTVEARAQIDRDPSLPELVSVSADQLDPASRSSSAFAVWQKTSLNRERLTSAVELYNASGELVSRFGLNFPEYTGSAQKPQAELTCHWEMFGEAQPFGSEERRMLHAERSVCIPGGQVVGTIVVHVMLDYRNLPFVSSQSPYFELFRPTESRAPGEGAPGSDVDVAIYGWGLHPIYTSGRSAWSITDVLFDQLYDAGRRPFWARIARADGVYQVYFTNDRFFIYALGYPVLTLFDHLVHLAELTTLAGLTFVIVLIGTATYTRIAREHTRVGRALLREIRASFYRKLFFAFVLAAVVPVLTLAFVIRTYFADLLRDAVQAEAARTAAVAQRVIQESDALWRRNSQEIAPGSDDVMVSISQMIEQDLNIFDGPQLLATSERDLFSSGFLPTRTPGDVYRAIVLDRLPSFVDEDQIGTVPYLIAAAPVRTGDSDLILTIPLTNRRSEIEQEIDDLDRGVHLAALFFVLLGAAIGLSLAERIADPVRRLTRATRRIAAGDFDARIAVRSSDELRRLVDAFNSMASELKAQQTQLERTHRLEAWAEMARQVAHEIKNPLTPIQLSAEHLLRVHADRGEPLSPVLEGCVTTILGQVRLLRQISAEFSSFASSPTARRAPVDLPPLVAEVVDPYRTGLEGRIAIDNRAAGPLPLVLVDPTLLTRALANIVENALHAMPGEGRLTIETASAPDAVVLSITDTGVGMDPDALSRVFEPYFSTKATGTGLGLPIARRNIELSGGAIDVTSEKGIGTRVSVTLSVLPANEPAPTVGVFDGRADGTRRRDGGR
jgi:signal transduction histidine kinase